MLCCVTCWSHFKIPAESRVRSTRGQDTPRTQVPKSDVDRFRPSPNPVCRYGCRHACLPVSFWTVCVSISPCRPSFLGHVSTFASRVSLDSLASIPSHPSHPLHIIPSNTQTSKMDYSMSVRRFSSSATYHSKGRACAFDVMNAAL